MKNADRTIDNIRDRITSRLPVPGKKDATMSALDRLLAEASELIRAGTTAYPVIDGYPRLTPGAGASSDGSGSRLHDDVSELDTRPSDAEFKLAIGSYGHSRPPVTTPTERAMLAREHGIAEPDPVGRLATRQQRQLELLVKVLDKIAATNAAFHRQHSIRDEDTTKPYCHVARMHGLPWDEKWEAVYTTDFATVKNFETLSEPVSVCQSVYDWVRHHKRYPTKDEMLLLLGREVARAR